MDVQLPLYLGTTPAQRRANARYAKTPKGVEANRRYQEKRRSREKTPDERARAAEASRRHYERNRDLLLAGQRAYQMQRRYGVTVEEYDAMLEQQGGGCAICGATQPDASGRRVNFAVDHDHATQKVRGLLCSNCNSALGLLGEKVDEAVRYLENARQ